jgi:CHAT domain-containing protein
MDPLRPLLTPSRQVFLSPDGALNLVPFAALVDQSGQYLVTRYEFSYLTSGRDLLRLQAPRPERRSAMVVADPDFGELPSPGGEGSHEIELKYEPGSRSSILSNAFFPPLPGTAEEARALKAMLPGAMVLTGARATEAAIKRAAGPGILHIATHGFFLSDVAAPNESRDLTLSAGNPGAGRIENPLLRSGLALSGANLRKTRADHEDDGILTAEEASALDLWGTTLVVMSACDTGVGNVRNGEGVYGLRRAMALAGAETQVMSLWPVSDKATRDLMIEYYKKLLSGTGRSEALRAAQLRMLAGGPRAADRSSRILLTKSGESPQQTTAGKTRDYSHPYYWACFIQSGEWKKLDLVKTPPR